MVICRMHLFLQEEEHLLAVVLPEGGEQPTNCMLPTMTSTTSIAILPAQELSGRKQKTSGRLSAGPSIVAYVTSVAGIAGVFGSNL